VRTVYLGTSDFAATVLRRLADSPHKPSLVVTRPARPKGRGRSLQDPPVAEVANELGIPVFQPDSVNEPDAVARIQAENPEAICVCAFGAIVKDDILGMATNFNVHPSLLPRWRGAAPVERAIAAGDEQTGVSIMALVEELDAGPICAQVTTPIAAEDTYGSIASQLSSAGSDLLVEALERAAGGTIEWTDQSTLTDQRPVTYAEKITREDRVLKPTSASAVELDRMVRALTPHIGAMFETTGGDPLRVEQARPAPDEVAAGTVIEREGRLLVGTADGSLELLRVKPAGGKAMDAASFLRGNDIPQLAG
jgi:methionyl-tRNA formyltransferase